MSDTSIQQSIVQRGSRAEEVSTQRPSRFSPRWRNEAVGVGFVLPLLIVYVLFLLWPIVLGLRMSFFNWSLVGSGSGNFLGLANYQEALSDPNFWGALGNTLIFTVMSTPILVILSLFLAILVNRVRHVRWLFRIAFFAPYILPVSVMALIWSWLYEPGFGLLDGTFAQLGLPSVNWLTDTHVAMLSIVIATVWWTLGFDFVLYLAGLQQIPQEMYEAASLDGAGGWAKVWHITIPLLQRSTILIIILQVIASLQVFGQMYLLTGGGPNFTTRSVVEYIYDTGFTDFRVGYASAMSYLVFIVILVISVGQFWLLSRQGRND
jgi:multiple sugar transport system permease protein